ncbi:MAG: putative manganese-dependent inorganic diphosphatase [Treponemataceae bacterium]|nr:putative manganese-dependent inorganic diphosphatase [Treponemataceae bacterium]
MKQTVYVIGHRNPDTDSVVAAIAYARLKNLQGHAEYVAARAGHLSPQTDYILKRFNVPKSQYFHDLQPRVEFYMPEGTETVLEDKSVWSAVEKLQKNGWHSMPVVDGEGRYKALLHYSGFAKNILDILNPERQTAITTSVELIRETLDAQPLCVRDDREVFKGLVLVADDSLETFKKIFESHLSEKVIVVTGDRTDIQDYCIENGVRALVIVSSLVPTKEIIAKAEKKKIPMLLSSYDTSSTVLLTTYSSPVAIMADTDVPAVHKNDSVKKIRPILHASPSRSLTVVDDDNKVVGMITENDLLHDALVEIALVDHNEVSQAAEGIEHYTIREIIDHHRIGTVTTRTPITFINKPVGSTSTIVANLYRESHVSIPLEIAQVLLCGILSDTLILHSATTTDIDRETADYLSSITGLDVQTLGQDVLNAGSHIGARSAADVIKQDKKEYRDERNVYTVSQIEVDGTDELLARKQEFLDELEITRRSHGALFSALLVTDIARLSSLMLVSADKHFLPYITFPKQEDNVYFLKDVMSRKKQLIPLLSELIERYNG